MRAYQGFAAFYDGLTKNVGYEERADYLMELFRRHRHSPGLTLDLACGTGSLILALAKRGVDTFGADASSDMLTVAQQKLYENDLSILLLHQKMQKLELYGQIDTCVCTLDSINHLDSPEDVTETFRRIAKYLNKDGLFVFDCNTVYKHSHVLGDNCFIYDTDEVFCAWQNSYTEDGHRVDITLDFFEPVGKSWSRYTEQFSERAYTPQQIEDMLGQAGLYAEAIYDDMKFSGPAPDSQRVIYTVRKK